MRGVCGGRGVGCRSLRGCGSEHPCACGSGRKYKKCHLPLREEQQRLFARAAHCHRLDTDVAYELLDLAEEEVDDDRWLRTLRGLNDVAREAPHLLRVLLAYGPEFEGATLAERGARRFGKEARRWIAAQQAAWFSVWEVLEVEAERGGCCAT
ncbi:MAG: SEC-C metal-binding domain-containing protein [Acidobacteriota bacterium]|nr:SEC-C metal-binding domain-containing protein [Acidobacteriota bacterium]